MSTSTLKTLTWSTPLSSSTQTYTYLVNAPDFETDSKRLELRSDHVNGAKEGLKTGRIINAGAMFEKDKALNPSENKMIGSWLLCRAESIEEVEIMCKNDIYYQKGAWDPEKLEICCVANLL
ncbi:uncharacterized protein MELLADRAFT_111285 [Melampsora larici-populina 98AG31]|uniref:YCII-related domain-containing protein n=1 Tax=Melampsora larici-populina (strain 98AG31 / pathotype 3-4-7) TaxID=747676 RepID=F4S2M5_MELLP|nr:uncharacterized protein MELLADRAFT_111285 [Melampsora larici-populina 98AG31]EGG01104.1 hypothetical protein MELLADRAFT_111285 [Melampsora larici-populina 98AG31]